MIYYANISVDSGRHMIHAGVTHAESLTQLKKNASRITNRYFSTLDKMEISFSDPKNSNRDITLGYDRINRKAPNNTIVRGQWK